jgi:hypothetical protein
MRLREPGVSAQASFIFRRIKNSCGPETNTVPAVLRESMMKTGPRNFARASRQIVEARHARS